VLNPVNVEIAYKLAKLGTANLLVVAAFEGYIPKLECMMPTCICPHGRAYFEVRGGFKKWQPSADRVVPNSKDGKYTVDNIRLSHVSCNVSAGSKLGDKMAGYNAGNIKRIEHQRKWAESEEGKVILRETAKKNFTKTKAYSKAGPERRVENGKHFVDTYPGALSCSRWQISKGKECICGKHFLQDGKWRLAKTDNKGI
jgi:hypothetical protein